MSGSASTGQSLAEQVPSVLAHHPSIDSVALTGSRARGEETELSDWDFKIETRDFASVGRALPALVAPLEPLAVQWDRLSVEQCYMLMLRGAIKVDLIFDEPHAPEPPWELSAETLNRIDDHFWDWIIWLAAKDTAGKRELVAAELGKMHQHLLAPLGVVGVPSTIEEAVEAYGPALRDGAARLGVRAPHELGREVRGRLAGHRYAV